MTVEKRLPNAVNSFVEIRAHRARWRQGGRAFSPYVDDIVLRHAKVVRATTMSETFDCEARARDYLSMAEAETDQALKALLFDMWRNWLLLGQLEQIDAPSRHNGGHGAMPRVAPGALTAWVFRTLVRAEARGEPIGAYICRALRELLYERVRRRARMRLSVPTPPGQSMRGGAGKRSR
jgi:hypothetical protein